MKKLNLKEMAQVMGGDPPPWAGVPFAGLINNGCGPIFPNINGYANSANAFANAGVFGAPLIINGGGSGGNACPLPFINPPSFP